MAVLAASAGYGQDLTDAALTGKITAQDNSPIRGVRVQITSPSLLSPRNAVTDANGSYRLSMLPPGQYSVTYSLDGYISRRLNLQLVAGVTSNGSLKLQRVDVQAITVEITAEASSDLVQIDKTETVTQTSFTGDRMEEILGSRSLNALKTLTPGISSGPLAGSTLLYIRGGMGRGAKIMQDGQIINDMASGTEFYGGSGSMEDMVESMAIIQSPLNAKLGNTDGGIISITTKRGGNTFSGSLRYTGTRGQASGGTTSNMWTYYAGLGYPDRRGYQAAPGSVPYSDNMSRTWDFTVTGPIIQNYLTFSYGGSLQPTSYLTGYYQDGGDFAPTANQLRSMATGTPPWNAALGTWYHELDSSKPGYGDVVRRSELEAIYWNSPLDNKTWNQQNVFNIYLEIMPEHRVSYYYMERESFLGRNGGMQMGDRSDDYNAGAITRSWNLSYKGIIGSSGVLDVRYGRSRNIYNEPASGKMALDVRTYKSYYDYGVSSPINLSTGPGSPTAPPYDFTRYNHNGFIDAYFQQSAQNDQGVSFYRTIGFDAPEPNNSGTTSTNLNYQHMLEFNGMHMIDIGFNREEAYSLQPSPGAPYYFNSPGHIARDLASNEIGNTIRRTVGGDVSRYRDKYIVFNVTKATVGSIDPHVGTHPNYNGRMLNPDQPLAFRNTVDGTWALNQLSPDLLPATLMNVVPWMRHRYGNEDSEISTDMQAFYVNDMWTINDNHSVMLGVRIDKYNVGDGVRSSVANYTKMTPRFEYKYDIFGDQRHLLSFSYGQFHSMSYLSLYLPFLDRKNGDTKLAFWTGADMEGINHNSPYPYLVDRADVINPKNYTDIISDVKSGSISTEIEKGFKPPTSSEITFGYRRAFNNGGMWRVSFVYRNWIDLYDFFPGEVWNYENPETGDISKRHKTVLRNTDEFSRTYAGVEMQWDIPITKKIVFGGNYTNARAMNNQSEQGSGNSNITSSTALRLQTFHFDEYWPRNVWSPDENTSSEYNLTYYLTVNLTQGKAKSNFTFGGYYTAAHMQYDLITYRVGYQIIGDPINGYSNQYATGTDGYTPGLSNSRDIRINESTGFDSFSNHLQYNMSMPLFKKLNWFVNIRVNNPFNHRAKNWSVAGGRLSTTYTPFEIVGPTAASTTAPIENPYPTGYVYRSSTIDHYTQRISGRTMTMTTGLRF
jgi:hypothetical protein